MNTRRSYILLPALIAAVLATPAQAQNDTVTMKVENDTHCQTKITVEQDGVFLKTLRLDGLTQKDFAIVLRNDSPLTLKVVTSGCNEEARYTMEDVVASTDKLRVIVAEQPIMSRYFALRS